jgi:copper chaperone
MNSNKQKIILNIHGMSCGSCIRHVEGALQPLPGVSSVTVDLAAGSADIRGTNLELRTLLAAIAEAGYSAEEVSQA